MNKQRKSETKTPRIILMNNENDLAPCMKIESSTKNPQIKSSIEEFKGKQDEHKLSSYRIAYVPKRIGKLNPSSLINSLETVKQTPLIETLREQTNGDTFQNFIQNPQETENFKFRTTFMLKFKKNQENFHKLTKYFDLISANNSKLFEECYRKINSLSEQRDKILFDTKNLEYIELNKWKHIIVNSFEFEYFWINILEIIFKELKSSKDYNLHLGKKVCDQENLLKLKTNEIKYLNDFIAENDINYKSILKKKRMSDLNDLKETFFQRENLYKINMNRLEDEIRDLTSLLDKDREYFQKYNEAMEKLEEKRREIEELRLKSSFDLEENKLKMSYLNTEKHELQQIIKTLEKEIQVMKDKEQSHKQEYIDHYTQIKILNQAISEKNETIQMLNQEIETWIAEIQKEKQSHRKTAEALTALEIKQEKEKEKHYTKIILN